MHVLNLSSDYSKQQLYSILLAKMQSMGIRQDIYVPVRSATEIGRYDISELPNTTITYAHILHNYHRLLFNRKIKTIFDDLIKTINLEGIELTHANFLFSDGAVALLLKNNYQIPFIVAIRNTDLNIFFKYMLHLRKIGIKIMMEAKHIIFITPSYIDQIIDNYIPDYYKDDFKRKVSILPNGIDEFWLQNKSTTAKKSTNIIKLLYVGDFTKNKNVLSIVKATQELDSEKYKISLTIVGDGSNHQKKVLKDIAITNSHIIKYVESVEERKKLWKYYNSSNIFIMPSVKETFGIVYLEAMSQGLPIIFTKGQGIDGYFEDNQPGIAVNPFNIQEIKNSILHANNNLSELSRNALMHIDNFNWDIIALKYKLLYQKIINE